MLEATVALLVGLLIGSFLNVCIYRMPRDLSVVHPRSHCIACGKTIAWYDNVPVLSYAVLRGRCRHCGAAISLRYPVVEILTGILFFAYVLLFGPGTVAMKYCLLGALLVALIFTDLESRILPDEFTLGGLAAGLLLAWFIPIEDVSAHALLWLVGIEPSARWISVCEAFLGAALPSGFLWLGGFVYEKVRHREGLGLGDVKLLAMIGAFLGLRTALMALLAGSLVGSVLGLSYIVITRKDASTYQLPFGTFLGAGAIAVSLVGRRLMEW